MSAYIDAHLTHLRAAGRSQRTVADRGDVLRRFDSVLPYGLIRAATQEIERWLAQPQWSRWTLLTYYNHLSGFFSWAARGREPMISWNPMVDIPRPTRPKQLPDPVTDDQLARALRGSDGQWRLIILLAAYAGLRVSEIARLERRDVTESVLRVRGGKGGKDAVLPTHPLIHRGVADMPDGPLIRRPSGKPVTGRWISGEARGHFNRLDLADVHVQRFRHWFGTAVHAVREDLLVTQQLMRHEDPHTTSGYAQVTERQRSTLLELPVFDF